MLNIEELVKTEMLNSSFNKIQNLTEYKSPKPPGHNPWTKYIIVAGIIGVALMSAYFITKPKNEINYGKEEN